MFVVIQLEEGKRSEVEKEGLTSKMERENVETVRGSMTESSRRRRRARGGSKPEVLRPSEPEKKSSEGSRVSETRQRQSKMNLTSPTELTEEKNQGVAKKGILVMRQGIDEIRAELGEERNSALLESDYWDETHSWGADDEEASDEYWHFVGRYE